jgi:type I restriction enzyme S subunit
VSDHVSLDDFVRLKRGYDLPERDRREGEVPILGSFGITGRHDTAKQQGPGVTIGRSGASIGVATYYDGPYWPLNTTLYVENFKGNDPRFAYFVLDAIDFRPHNSGAAQPSLNRNYLGSIRVWRPELSAQRKVATALGSLDDLAANNQRRIELLENMARLLYRQWFVHFRFPGYEGVKLADSDLGPIPEGWDVARASSVFEVNPRERVGESTEHKFITMSDLSDSCMVCWPSELKAGNSGARFRNGDTLFARITPCLENGKTGLVACLNDDELGRGSTEFIVLRGAEVGPEFTYLTARDEGFRQNAIKSMSGASGRQRVRNECFDSYSLAVPPPEVEQAFQEAVRPMFELVFSLARQNTVLSKARGLLLPRLISGEVDVSRLDLYLKSVA